MSDAALFEDAAFDADDGLDELDELDGFEDSDFAADGLDELDDFVDELDADGLDGLDDMADELDELDYAGDFAFDEASDLFLPGLSGLISGPAATSIMRLLNPAVMDSLDADEVDAFFGRIGGFLKRAAKSAAPMLRRALPMVQNVAGYAGPWGRLVSAGIGGVQGLLDGKGLKGALSGAVGGLLPGAAGNVAQGLLSGVLGGDGAEDDAAVDAMADLFDAAHPHAVHASAAHARAAQAAHAHAAHAHAAHAAHAARAAHAHGVRAVHAHPAHANRLHAAVALPIGAGLVTRVIGKHGLAPALRHLVGSPAAMHRVHGLSPRLNHVERQLLGAAHKIPGSVGRRLQAMRRIGHHAAHLVRRRSVASPASAVRAIPAAVRAAIRQVVPRVVRAPHALVRSPAVAARRVRARRILMRRTPVDIVLRASIVRAR